MEENKTSQKNIGIIILVAIVVAAGSFYGGMLYGASQKSTANTRNGSGFVPGARSGAVGAIRGAGQGAGLVNGSVIKKDDKTITVQLRDGGSKTIYVTDTTTVGKTVEGSQADLNIGENVMVNGKANADGSVIAENVQIRPADAPGMPNRPGGVDLKGQKAPEASNAPVVK